MSKKDVIAGMKFHRENFEKETINNPVDHNALLEFVKENFPKLDCWRTIGWMFDEKRYASMETWELAVMEKQINQGLGLYFENTFITKKHVRISPAGIGNVLSEEERKSLINIVDKLLVNGIELGLKYDSIQNAGN